VVTYVDLYTVDPSSWNAAAEAMRRLGEAIAVKGDELGDVIEWLAGRWAGSAATAALNRLSMMRAELYAAFPGIVAIDQTLTELGNAVGDAQRRLLQASRPRPGSVVQVALDGTVSFVPTCTNLDDTDFREQFDTEQTLSRALDDADRADRIAAARLPAVRFEVDASAPLPAAPPGHDPIAVAAWWHGLTPDQQRHVIVAEPATIAGLDGVPADDRDQASRLLLHRQAALLRTQDAMLRSSPNPDPRLLAGVDGDLDGVQVLEDRLDGTGGVRAYLLGVDAPAGRAIVSIANPDDAANTLTFIPGVSSGLRTIGTALTSIDNIEQTGMQLPSTASWSPAEAGTLATIGWVNYDAPTAIRHAGGTAPADAAAGPLSTFESGLRTTTTVPDGHETVLGYSYGSVIAGAAARQDGLHADDVILVGSPGTGVNRAADLGVPAADVWATAARNDLVPRLTTPRTILSELLGDASDRSWFGTNPTAPAFGANVFTSNPGRLTSPIETHTAYFDVRTPSLTNIARIAVGDSADVCLMTRRPLMVGARSCRRTR